MKPALHLEIVSMDRRTLYDSQATAQAMRLQAEAAAGPRSTRTFVVGTYGTGYVITVYERGCPDPIGWLFDGAFARPDDVWPDPLRMAPKGAKAVTFTVTLTIGEKIGLEAVGRRLSDHTSPLTQAEYEGAVRAFAKLAKAKQDRPS